MTEKWLPLLQLERATCLSSQLQGNLPTQCGLDESTEVIKGCPTTDEVSREASEEAELTTNKQILQIDFSVGHRRQQVLASSADRRLLFPWTIIKQSPIITVYSITDIIVSFHFLGFNCNWGTHQAVTAVCCHASLFC